MSDDPNRPTVLKSVSSEVEAVAIMTLLGSHGIEASTTGGFTAGFRAEAPGAVQIIVRAKDLEDSQRALESFSQEIDWSQVDVGDEHES